MANNDFLVFGGNGAANVIDQASYSAMDARAGGFSIGIAKSAQANKVWRQSSIMAAVLAQFIADCTGKDARDDGTTQALLANLKQAVPAAVNDAGVNSSQKINGANAANLLFNGSGEFGNVGWGSSNFPSVADAKGGGTIFLNTAAVSVATEDVSAVVMCGAGVPMTVSGEMTTGGVSAGRAYVMLEAFTSGGASLGVFAGPATVSNGSSWTFANVSGVTPTGTAQVVVRRGVDTSPNVRPFGLGFRRIKIERGNTPSLYSQEASIAAAPMPVVGSVRNLTMSVVSPSVSAAMTADEIVVGTALGGFGYKLANFNQTINLATTGLGGMDMGSAPASGYVALYAIYNPANARQALLATDVTRTLAPEVYSGVNLPPGYTASSLVSVVRTNANGQFLPFRQLDRAVWVPPVGILGVAVDGGPQWHAVDCSGLCPRNAKTFRGYATAGNDSAGVFNISMAGDAIGSGSLTSNVASTGSSAQFVNVPILTPQTIFLWYRFLGTPASLGFTYIGTGYTF
ncbi:hypothetical protein Bsp3421_002808 [Burkholderia sp. FERM BP-3421]|uniref:hypothetical protein n=1 Tax=Burkholderia sp. FERM BP-3421 TaxID=1494466 RepID=UPI00235DFDCB|nr:hypothetical protein [Burkholderia sp. FERM BP-3421]WDD92779.1 hypothetical protein Bsp3421_002808 [Burkholderia sp. FERM BP-3421]